MYRVTGLQPLSWAKTYTLAMLAIAFIVAVLVLIPLLVVLGFAAIASGDSNDISGYAVLAAISVVAVFAVIAAVALATFVVSLLQGIAFNWAMGRTGGIRVDLALSTGFDDEPADTANGPDTLHQSDRKEAAISTSTALDDVDAGSEAHDTAAADDVDAGSEAHDAAAAEGAKSEA